MESTIMEVSTGKSELMISSGDTMISVDGGYVDGGTGYDGSYDGSVVDGMTGMESSVKDPLMSSWLFVGGISAIVLAGAVVLGILLAKKRIKKGYDLYEI